MLQAVIEKTACDRSPGCPAARVCPRGAVVRRQDGPYAGTWTVDAERCTGCGMCVRVCPAGAVSMSER